MKKILLIFLLIHFVQLTHAQQADTFQVYFSFNDTKINKQASDYIDNLIFKDMLIHGQKLIVLGYADYVGDNKYNETLSAMRAKNVQEYLVSAGGLDRKDIKLCIGKGKIERAANGKDGYAQDRKVQIIIDRLTDTPARITPHPAMAAAKVNETVSLNNILFEPSTDKILDQSLPELEMLLKFLTDNPTVRIQIEGHICCMAMLSITDEPYGSSTLSESRAKAVYNYLLSKGIAKNRLQYVGLGNTMPLVKPERNQEDQMKNRRVTIRILSK